MADDERVNVMQVEEEADQFSESNVKAAKEKKPRVRKTKEEKISAIDDKIAFFLEKVAQLTAQKDKLLLSPEDKTKIRNHVIYIIGGVTANLLKIDKEKCTAENIEKGAYEYLEKHDKNSPLYVYYVEEMDKIFKK